MLCCPISVMTALDGPKYKARKDWVFDAVLYLEDLFCLLTGTTFGLKRGDSWAFSEVWGEEGKVGKFCQYVFLSCAA